MTTEKTMEQYVDEVTEKLEEASKCPVAIVDYSGDGGPFGFHVVLVNPKLVLIVAGARVFVNRKSLEDPGDPCDYIANNFSLEALFPVWKYEEPVAINLIAAPESMSFTDFDPWVDAFYAEDIDVLGYWPEADLVVANFKMACQAVKIICEQAKD